MNLSYWERETFYGRPNTIVVGSGITGLSTAIHWKRRYPDSDVLVVERGSLPSGASTRNAGFACFGSAGEILDDLSTMDERKVEDLVAQRWEGLQLLRDMTGAWDIGYQASGSLELFSKEEKQEFEAIADQLDRLNKLVRNITGREAFSVEKDFAIAGNSRLPYAIKNRLEGSLDTGKMMLALLKEAEKEGVRILTGTAVSGINSKPSGVEVRLPQVILRTERVFVCTNGFARELMPDLEVRPARNQVLLSEPIPNLPIRGIFHMDKGYIYFRNIGDRLLIGGFRNRFEAAESTSEFGMTREVNLALRTFVRNTLLPGIDHEWEMGWSGILGIGEHKLPIIKEVQPNVFAGVRLGGMGVALGAMLGLSLSQMP